MEFLSKILEWLLAQQGAIFLSALIGVWVARGTIKESRRRHDTEIDENRNRDKIKATLDYLTRREWDADYISTRSEFAKLRDAAKGLEPFGKKGRGGFSEQNIISRALNDYEIVAVGIKKGILDEEFYKLWCKSGVITDFKAAQGYINALNKAETEKNGYKTRYYCEFCELGTRWTKDD